MRLRQAQEQSQLNGAKGLWLARRAGTESHVDVPIKSHVDVPIICRQSIGRRTDRLLKLHRKLDHLTSVTDICTH